MSYKNKYLHEMQVVLKRSSYLLCVQSLLDGYTLYYSVVMFCCDAWWKRVLDGSRALKGTEVINA